MPINQPELHEKRDGVKQWIQRINWLLRQFPLSASSGSGANWPYGTTRYFGIDYDHGSDSAIGYSDASPAQAGILAVKTMERMGAILPRFGNGRSAMVIIRSRANGASYLKQDGVTVDSLDSFLAGVSGYAPIVVQATDTVASASYIAFQDTDPSQIWGAQVVPGTEVNGYKPTGAPTTTSVQLLTSLGGAPGLAAEPALPLGARFRFSSTTATVALRNVWRTICRVSTTTTTNDTVGLHIALPAVPVVADVGYIEYPAVVCASWGIPGFSVVGRTTNAVNGIRSNGSINIGPGVGRLDLNFCSCASFFSTAAFALILSSFRSEGIIQPQRGRIFLIGAVSAGNTFLEDQTTSGWQDGSYAGAGLTMTGGPEGAYAGRCTIGSPSGTGVVNRAVGGISCTANRAGISNVEITGAASGISLRGKCELAIGGTAGVAPTGSSGNTVGLSLTSSAGSTLLLESSFPPSVTGGSGDVRLADGTIVTWASLTPAGTYHTTAGNDVIST